ncbi:hypothetical protein F383_33875 [Gossypium arboreum]|uniref:Uncharacterized protein n=1 Tax=Gossypium arboreum TaxID=29729 RepID=A0A0B0PPD9_GOSAR|nr:hypothetical protein F383_33875 [Gossypium arboreum]
MEMLKSKWELNPIRGRKKSSNSCRNRSTTSEAFVQVTKPGLSPEGIRASYYNRASSRRQLSKSLYPVKFRRFCSLAIGFRIIEVEVIHTIKAPILVQFWLNFEMACT